MLALALALPGTAFGAAPSATTGSASLITSSSANLSGTVNANLSPTNWQFDYATDAEYSPPGTYPHSTASFLLKFCDPFTIVCVPILVNDVGVNDRLDGLSANTTYHFRIVASNADGTTNGGDVTFTTLP